MAAGTFVQGSSIELTADGPDPSAIYSIRTGWFNVRACQVCHLCGGTEVEIISSVVRSSDDFFDGFLDNSLLSEPDLLVYTSCVSFSDIRLTRDVTKDYDKCKGGGLNE